MNVRKLGTFSLNNKKPSEMKLNKTNEARVEKWNKQEN